MAKGKGVKRGDKSKRKGKGGKGRNKPIFILGVGAQKAGTSWLHAALNDRPEVDMGFRKEYHIWDAKMHPDLFGKFVASPAKKGERADRALRRQMQTRKGAYEHYFAGLITKKIRVTGDITPTYSALSAEEYALIRQRLEAAGFDVRVVFLMRDPVQRVWSALRMMRRDKSKKKEMTDDQFYALFLERLEKPGNIARTDYSATVENLRKAFDASQLYFGFYENMFEKGSIEAISAHLGVDLTGFDTGTIVNASPKAPIPSELDAKCRTLHSEVYDYCAKEFPLTTGLWKA